MCTFPSRVRTTKYEKHDTAGHRYFKDPTYEPCPPLVRSKRVNSIQNGIKVQLWLSSNISRHYLILQDVYSQWMRGMLRTSYMGLNASTSDVLILACGKRGTTLTSSKRFYVQTSILPYKRVTKCYHHLLQFAINTFCSVKTVCSRCDGRGPVYWHDLALIPAWMCNSKHHKVWDDIIYLFLNFNGATVEV